MFIFVQQTTIVRRQSTKNEINFPSSLRCFTLNEPRSLVHRGVKRHSAACKKTHRGQVAERNERRVNMRVACTRRRRTTYTRSTNVEITNINRRRSTTTIRARKALGRVHAKRGRRRLQRWLREERSEEAIFVDVFRCLVGRSHASARETARETWTKGSGGRYTTHVKRTHAISWERRANERAKTREELRL